MGKQSRFELKDNYFYPTPFEAVLPLVYYLKPGAFIEPCAGDGRLIEHLEEFGFHISKDQKRISNIDTNQFNVGPLTDMYNINKNFTSPTKYAINETLYFNETNINHLLNKIKTEDYKNISIRNKMLSEILIKNGNTEINAWKILSEN